jgi:limonene-1,2-epoxide hydrolase
MGVEEENEHVVRSLLAALSEHDTEALRGFLTDDVVYHNIPMDPAVGIDASLAFLESFFGMFESIAVENLHVATRGDAVLTERIDTMSMGGAVAPLPVMGTFELRDGKVSAWRDYFDLAQVTQMLGG